jgi:hypothetical protein
MLLILPLWILFFTSCIRELMCLVSKLLIIWKNHSLRLIHKLTWKYLHRQTKRKKLPELSQLCTAIYLSRWSPSPFEGKSQRFFLEIYFSLKWCNIRLEHNSYTNKIVTYVYWCNGKEINLIGNLYHYCWIISDIF